MPKEKLASAFCMLICAVYYEALMWSVLARLDASNTAIVEARNLILSKASLRVCAVMCSVVLGGRCPSVGAS